MATKTVRFHVYRKLVTVGLLMDMEEIGFRQEDVDPETGLPRNPIRMRELHDVLVPFCVDGNGRQLPEAEASQHVRALTLEQMNEAFAGIMAQIGKLSDADVPPTSGG